MEFEYTQRDSWVRRHHLQALATKFPAGCSARNYLVEEREHKATSSLDRHHQELPLLPDLPPIKASSAEGALHVTRQPLRANGTQMWGPFLHMENLYKNQFVV